MFHTNEGHAGFLGLERIRELTVEESGPKLDFDTALEVSRASTVFTTHTPVPAGIDRFSRELIEQYFGSAGPLAGVPIERILALGAEDYAGGDPTRVQHGGDGLPARPARERRLAAARPRQPRDVPRPVAGLRRGRGADHLDHQRRARPDLGRRARSSTSPTRHGADGDADDADSFWNAVDQIAVRRHLGGQAAAARAARARRASAAAQVLPQARRRPRPSSSWVDEALDPDVLTIGFARRVPSYKRLTLMLRDPERLKRLLLHPERPVQLVIAGKAHPADDGGKKLIQEIVRFADDPEVRHRIVFLPNYDIAMAQPLYPGCDVWLNNPLRPYEACGTSGMKAALNGGLNLSILDGWWDEWYDGSNGWAIPSADGVDDPDRRDDLEAAALYDLIEKDVAPRFYDVDHDGVPGRWIEMVRHTLKSLGPKVLATRMVRDYVRQLYTPAAVTGRALNSDYKGATELAALEEGGARRLGRRTRRARREPRRRRQPRGRLDADRPRLRRARLADARRRRRRGGARRDRRRRRPRRHPRSPGSALADSYDGGRYRFDGEVELQRGGAFGYTVRIVPRHSVLASVSEMGLVALP